MIPARSLTGFLAALRLGFVFGYLVITGMTQVHAQPGVSFDDIPAYTAEFTDGGEEEDYEEILLTLNVPRIGSIEIPSMVYKEEAYLPVKDLFDYLRIRNIPSENFDVIQGFFIEPGASYTIDHNNSRIIYQYKTHTLDEGALVRTENNLYLRSDYFGEIFGLDCIFDFRSLTVTLNTKIELPIIREMQLELMRRNINNLRGEKKADTTIERSFPLFRLGMADWSVISSQETNKKASTRFNLGLGGIVAGGEMNVSMNLYSDQPNTMRQQFYQWRYVDNDNAALRQITAGKIFPQSTSSLFAPVVGVQLTNTATTYKKSFGTYTISNTTEPGWTVELYVNNVLVNYTKADASGFFTFEVPMVYGNSMIKLRFYGPWGEEQFSEKYISVPYQFMPAGQLEYSLTAGVVEDDKKARFSRANLNYGLGKIITIGGGVEYLSTLNKGKIMPYVNASLRVGANVVLSGEHVYGVKSKSVLNYRSSTNLQVDLSYTRFVKNQLAVRMDFLEEKKIVASAPIRIKKFNAFSRLTINQFILPGAAIAGKPRPKYTSAELLFSGLIAGISTNLTTYAVFSKPGNPLVYTNMSLNFRVPGGLRINPQAQYEYSRNHFSKVKIEVERNLFMRGFANVSFEKNFTGTPGNIISVGLRYNFSFAQTFFSASKAKNVVRTVQSARGSVLYDSRTNHVSLGNQTQMGKGGIVVIPFLDLNNNGERDEDEHGVKGIKLNITGGLMDPDKNDSIIRITNLEAYTSYYIEVDKNSFDNIAWQIRKPTIKVVVDPNQFKAIEVPISVLAEVSGTVKLEKNNTTSGLARIIVNITDESSNLVAKVITEQDGYFSYMGLAPGKYKVSIDQLQMEKLHLSSTHAYEIKVAKNQNGDIISNLDFLIK